MNHPRLLAFLTALSLCSGLAAAAETHVVFVTAPNEGKILKVVATVNGTVTKTVSLVKKVGGGFTPKDINFGPDGKLYVISGNKIHRLNENGSGFTTFFTDTGNLGGIRFLANVLYFTDTSGVKRITNLSDPSGSLEQVVFQTLNQPGGITFSLNGQLLFLENASTGKLFRVSPPFGGGPVEIAGSSPALASPISVATNPGTDASANQKYVSANGAIRVLNCDDSACTDTSSDIPFSPDSPRDLEFNLAGQALVATQGSTSKLWLVNGSSPLLLVDFSTLSGQTRVSSIWGVALPPTTRSQTRTFNGTVSETLSFDCGNSLVKLTHDSGLGSGNATVNCILELPANVNDDFSGPAAGATCVPYDWNNGFCTLMDITLPVDGNLVKLQVGYVRASEAFLSINPLLARSTNGLNNLNFNQVTITNFHLAGEFAPGDPTRVGCCGSVDVVADEPIANALAFIAFFPDISRDPNDPTILQGQSSLPVRVAFEGQTGNEIIRLSAACTDGFGNITFIDPVTSVGGANVDNFFRFETDKFVYNWNLNNVPTGQTCALTIWGETGTIVDGYIFRQP